MVALSSAQKLLHQEIVGLPENLATEVLDFVQFLKARRTEETFLWERVEATRAHRQEHPDEVRTVTAEEWLAEIADEAGDD